MAQYSEAYLHHYKRGPFAGRVDPWAEDGHFFQQIHAALIDNLQDRLQDQLIVRGYQAGRETSLQIFANRQPDIFIESAEPASQPAAWDYDRAAASIAVEAGTRILATEPELQALHIYTLETHELVTVVEIISPRNKTHPAEMRFYQEERARLFLARGVNVVEIDLTRSAKRLVTHTLTLEHPYHTAIFIPGDLPRVLVSEFLQPLKPFALPLRDEVILVDVQPVYDRAYQRGAIAGLILKASGYSPESLPFPSLLKDEQKHAALATVQAWQAELEHLRTTEA